MNLNFASRLLRAKWRVMAAAAGLSLLCSSARATLGFLGVAAGDVTANEATLWTRAVDVSSPASASLTLQVSTDPTFAGVLLSQSDVTIPAKDYTLKLLATGLQPATLYYYRFVGPNLELSNVGKFKTAPVASANYPLHFAFSGDYDGLMRPYTLGNNFTANSFDFFMNVGDTIYETGSTGSPAVTATGSFGAALPTNSVGASSTQLYADFTRKYREQFIAINGGGQNCLQDFFAAQGNYTLLDNHELGNKQYMHGGASAGGSVGGSSTGAGVDPANPANDVNTSGTFINKTPGFAALVSAYTDYQPIKNRGLINAPSDPRTDGTQQLYLSQQWGRNAVLINTDTRSYRDIRLRTGGNADDTGPRADNPNRTYFGATQLAWLEQQLLMAEQNGTAWKFVVISDPIDQIGPIGGALSGVTSATMQPYSGNAAYGPVSADGGKALMGGYRAERNALLKYIADHQIRNVVFLATDDHQNRINEILYSPTDQIGVQSSYVKVPYCFEIVDGPFGATGPDLFLNHDWNSVQGSASLIANAQAAAGIDPIGLAGYPGLHNVQRDQNGVLVNEANPQAADFYSPDTFNYNIIDLSADGRTLTVKSIGINSYAQNNRVEANTGNQVGNTPRTIFSFQIDSASPLNNIDHIIVVYQENWSFDALYGSFPGANGLANASSASLNQLDRLNGLSLSSETGLNTFNRYTGSGNVTPANTNGNPGFLNIAPQPLNGSVDTRFNTNPADATSPLVVNTLQPYNINNYIATTDKTGDIVHRYWQEQFQINDGSNNQFLTWSDNPGLVMSNFDATNLPEGLLAQQYTMCDNFFHSAFGGSFLNHQFLVAAAAPVYAPWTTADLGNVAYLDTNGVLAMNTSGTTAGKVVRDGNITPVAGDQLTVTLNGAPNTVVSASPVVFADHSAFDQHYAVNTIFSANLQSSGSPTATTLLPSLNNSNPGDSSRPYVRTIGDLLDDANVSWKWYSGGWDQALAQSPTNPSHFGTTNTDSSISLFQWHHQPFAFYDKYAPFVSVAAYNGNPAAGPFNPFSAVRLQDESHLYTDITNSTLPSVSFVKFLGPDNEHPGYASLQQGQQHVADLVAAVQANPSLWAHTLIVITYDEHGGRWDHVTPPARDIWGPGVRVPAILISPFVKRGFVDHTQYDTSSVLTTIEQRFGLPSLNQRDGNASGLLGGLTNLQVTRGTFTLNRRTARMVQSVTITNVGAVPIVGPISLALDNLSANTSLANAAGTVVNNAPTGSPYIVISNGNLASGASATFTLQFMIPASGVITYAPRAIIGAGTP